jgi:hypothetical protein
MNPRHGYGRTTLVNNYGVRVGLDNCIDEDISCPRKSGYLSIQVLIDNC